MITRDQYIKALDIVEAYHKQINDSRNKTLTPIKKWDKYNLCSIRLQNALSCISDYQPYLENVTTEDLRKLRNTGLKSIHEFIELRGY